MSSRPPSCCVHTAGVPAMGGVTGLPRSSTRIVPGRSLTSKRPSGRNVMPQGVTNPSATISMRNAWRSLARTDPSSGRAVGARPVRSVERVSRR